MREIVLDTETTGLKPAEGHRLVEIGCVELNNRLPTGRTYQVYINPERDMPEEAFKVHGLSRDFLSQHPPFRSIYQDFLTFITEDTPLIIHNASFDMTFLNYELEAVGGASLSFHRVIDTLKIARQKFPGFPASLDMLCKRFKIDNTHRDKHGALLDAHLLADVYLELMGGRQDALSSILDTQDGHGTPNTPSHQRGRKDSPVVSDAPPRPPRLFPVSLEERENHLSFLQKIKNPFWSALVVLALFGEAQCIACDTTQQNPQDSKPMLGIQPLA